MLCPPFCHCMELLAPVFVANKGHVVREVCLLFRQTLWEGSGLDGCYRQGSDIMAAHAGEAQLLGRGLSHPAAFIRAPQLFLVA